VYAQSSGCGAARKANEMVKNYERRGRRKSEKKKERRMVRGNGRMLKTRQKQRIGSRVVSKAWKQKQE